MKNLEENLRNLGEKHINDILYLIKQEILLDLRVIYEGIHDDLTITEKELLLKDNRVKKLFNAIDITLGKI